MVAADAHGRVEAWACLRPFRGTGASTTTGELYALYVQPSLVGSGIGRTLLEAVRAHALAHGFDVVLLWVLNDSTTARRIYERAGYVTDGAVQADDYDGKSVSEIPPRRALAVPSS
ncbi:GNAT family N-acetyltransferase [Streptomyces sp. NPDC002917]|uniref:GNAT family N-acetyltransferase n=1 Tax=Streptomyces sp. NPDC002917 TaxID=3364671 RepID=UPI00367D6383